MVDKLNNFFDDLGGSLNNRTNSNTSSKPGVKKTDGISPQSLVGDNDKKYPPGFTPNDFYNSPSEDGSPNNDWIGNIPNNHPDSENYIVSNNSTNNKFEKDRSIYSLFNDKSTDFFKHGLHTINNLTPLKSEKDDRHTWDGENVDTQNPYRLNNFIGTPYENTDPVMFGFELVIDAARSPLFNGGVEDFISQFGFIKEVGSRSDIISNFKEQFFKFFKSNTPITSTGAEIDAKFYMSYYLKKVSGLEKLVEANTSETSKSFTDYKKDTIKLTFNEDVSLSIGSLSYLYKLLYWSKINGKNIIPQNLLRFNCDIIVSEVRNFNRVRQALNGGTGVEILKDNLSRYVYSLYECQLFFDKMPHDSEISLADPSKLFQDSYEVSFNYKFASTRFEKWVPDGQGFGKYSYLSNDRMDPFEIKPSETDSANTDGSGISMNSQLTNISPISQYILNDKSNSVTPSGTDEASDDSFNDLNELSTIDKLKLSSKKAAKNLSKGLEKAALNQIQNQINIRARLLNNSLDKIRNAIGIGRMSAPTNVYKPPSGNGIISNSFFYDVHNSLRDFLGDSLGGALNG